MHRRHFIKSVTCFLVFLGNTRGIACRDSWTPLTGGTLIASPVHKLLGNLCKETSKLKTENFLPLKEAFIWPKIYRVVNHSVIMGVAEI